MFVPPATNAPHMRFTAPHATTGAGITVGSFEHGVLSWGLGSGSRGPVAAAGVHVTIWSGDTVLFDGGPWLPAGSLGVGQNQVADHGVTVERNIASARASAP